MMFNVLWLTFFYIVCLVNALESDTIGHWNLIYE